VEKYFTVLKTGVKCEWSAQQPEINLLFALDMMLDLSQVLEGVVKREVSLLAGNLTRFLALNGLKHPKL
jgi:hypothetical protein